MIINPRVGLWIIVYEVRYPLLLMFLWDFVVVILYQVFHQEWMEQPSLPISLIGSALALFMGFRSSSAYARWWEAHEAERQERIEEWNACRQLNLFGDFLK